MALGHRAALAITAVVTVVAVVLGGLVVKDQIGSAQTYGRILVDSPEIYTRERLVNDRFLQDAWLTRQLETDGTSGSQIVSDSRQLRLGVTAPSTASAASTAGGAPARDPRRDTKDEPRLSSRDTLTDAVDFRDQVRNFLIENQLDDRHDLNGNALYRLKFDATVVPGGNTRALAEVRVRLLGPAFGAAPSLKAQRPVRRLQDLGSPESVRGWRVVYTRWLENLESRLNQTHKELKQAFVTNDFSHDDYARLIAFIRSNLGISTEGIPACPSAITDVRDQTAQVARMQAGEHAARRQCIARIVEKGLRAGGGSNRGGTGPAAPEYISRSAVATPPDPALRKIYPASAPQARRRDQGPLTVTSPAIWRELETWLNAFYASKTIQLVLGIAVPESTFVGAGGTAGITYLDLEALKPLTRLTFFNPRLETNDERVFMVAPKQFIVAAFDARKIAPNEFEALSTEPATESMFRGKSIQDFHDVGLRGTGEKKILVSRTDLDQLQRDTYDVDWSDFEPVGVRDGAFRAHAEVGLLNFARKARVHSSAFTYAVSPKENAVTVSSTFDVASSLAADVKPGGPPTGGLALDLRREAMARALNRRGTVVGYGSATKGGDSAEFGWIIGPTRLAADGRSLQRLHEPTQYALSALVSIPSWWNEVNVEATTSWVDAQGRRTPEAPPAMPYRVELPTDFEPLEATVLDVQQLGPELMESRLDPVLLSACRPGAIVIPGRRLWRSTVVTLGYQTADEISVLPNMKGIIAKFRRVENQASQPEELAARAASRRGQPFEFQRPVRIWTSQGTIALPAPARIGISSGCEKRTAARDMAP